MTAIKMCGLTKREDILAVNEIMPEYVGFVMYPKSKRYVDPDTAWKLKCLLSQEIRAVGVFVDEDVERVAEMVRGGVIDLVQLHGNEDGEYIRELRKRVRCSVIQAFQIRSPEDVKRAEESEADMILLDAGMGDGKTFDWSLIRSLKRDFILAGGLDPENVGEAQRELKPFGVDVSSGIETDGQKDPEKMCWFADMVRGCAE